MNADLLKSIFCPECNQDFELIEIENSGIKDKKFIETGLLFCKNNHVYPIYNQIPRLLPDAINSYSTVLIEKSKENKSKVEEIIKNRKIVKSLDKKFKHIHDSFSSEWQAIDDKGNAWGETIETRREMFLQVMQVKFENLKGKKILDAGAGHGEIILSIFESGAEIIAIEFSESVDIIKKFFKEKYPNHEDRLHLIQANIHSLPLKPDQFDLVHSAGVLHHTPDTFKGFSYISKTLKKNGSCYIEVYSTEYKNFIELIQYHTFRFLRLFTVYLPHSFLHFLCYLISLPAFLFTRTSNYISKNKRYNVRTIKEMELSMFDALSPLYDWHHTTKEVNGWFESLGYKNLKTVFYNHNGIGVNGVKSK